MVGEATDSVQVRDGARINTAASKSTARLERETKHLATTDGLALTKAFMRIKEPGLRRRIVELIEEIAGDHLNCNRETMRLFLTSHLMLRPPLHVHFRGAADAQGTYALGRPGAIDRSMGEGGDPDRNNG